MNIIQCCICSKTFPKSLMKYVPQDEPTLKYWIELFGNTFYQNWKKNYPRMVCNSHAILYRQITKIKRAKRNKYIAVKPVKQRTKNHGQKKVVKPKARKPAKPIILDELSSDVYGLHSYSQISQKINSGPYVDESEYLKYTEKLDSKMRNLPIIDAINREIYDIHSYSCISSKTSVSDYLNLKIIRDARIDENQS